MSKKIIALDCDGVLLNYNETYGRIFQEYFGMSLKTLDPTAYHVTNMFDITWPTPKDKSEFNKFFHSKGWGCMQPLPNAIQATHLLKQTGYHIVVVTSMPKTARTSRHNNLINLGFSIDETIATGRGKTMDNPKKPYIEKLKPDFFVDDLLKNFHTINTQTKFVLINTYAKDSPNLLCPNSVNLHSEHTNLLDFVQTHIAK
jgi:phosphoglycolate phosphatase-like HAD superfamily hydrolase